LLKAKRNQPEKNLKKRNRAMNLNDYFDPVSLEKPSHHILDNPYAFCRNIAIHTPNFPIHDLDQYKVAIIGVPEERNSINIGSAQGPDKIRNKLYQLIWPNIKFKVFDLGNMKIGKNHDDTIYGLRDILNELISLDIICIILGGAHQLAYSSCMVWEEMQKRYNLTVIDSHFDFETNPTTKSILAENFLNNILLPKTHLFSFINLGHQQYFSDASQNQWIENNFHHALRLGTIRTSIRETEPLLRDTHILSINMRSVRYADSPGYIYPSPNGLNGEEICQISRYAGTSQNLKIFGIFETNPLYDPQGISAYLAAQMTWYFIEGINQRTTETLSSDYSGFKKFIIKNNQIDPELVFYKSLLTERWWMEIPLIKGKSHEAILIACSEEDYKSASSQLIPERWWKLFRKIN
jgi:formiminoglutamase